jgi:hypothetical protein
MVMPRYHFAIRNTEHFDDEDGVILPGDGSAREYAIKVMDELQKDDEISWVHYTMEVMREGPVIWRIPFNRAPIPT